jgi:hypothetical protein
LQVETAAVWLAGQRSSKALYFRCYALASDGPGAGGNKAYSRTLSEKAKKRFVKPHLFMFRFVRRRKASCGVVGGTKTLSKKMRAAARELRVKQMLNLPNNGYKIFQVQLYNKQVREMVRRRKRHSFFDRLWARPQVRDVVARDEAEARALITERFPPEDGFVVERISASMC